MLKVAFCRDTCGLLKMALLPGLSDVVVVSNATDPWVDVRRLIDKFDFLQSASFSAGTASGRVFTYSKGNMRMSTQLPVFSSGKFVAA